MTLGLSLIGSPLVVYADDYEYIPLQDITTINAYRYFESYGWKLDYTNTISYNEQSSGTFTFTGTVNGTILGSQSNSFNVSLSGGLNTSENGSFISGSETGGILSSPVGVLNLTLSPVDSAYEQNTVLACTFSNPNTNVGYSSMSCSQGGGYEPAEYDVTLNILGLSTTNTTAYEINISETQSGGGSLSGTISLNETLTFSGSGSISLSGTSSTTGHKIYDIPMLSMGTLDNTFKQERMMRVNSRTGFNIIYLGRSTDKIYNGMTFKNSNGTNNSYVDKSVNVQDIGGFTLFNIEIKANSGTWRNVYVNFPDTVNNMIVLPLFVGYKYQIPDNIYRLAYGANASNTANMGNETSDSFYDSSLELNNIEQTNNNNMNSALQDIPTSSNLFSTDKFISSANWVKVQFERLVLNTPFELIIVYSLILGIALIFIGKVR